MIWHYYAHDWSPMPIHIWVPGKRLRVWPVYQRLCMRMRLVA